MFSKKQNLLIDELNGITWTADLRKPPFFHPPNTGRPSLQKERMAKTPEKKLRIFSTLRIIGPSTLVILRTLPLRFTGSNPSIGGSKILRAKSEPTTYLFKRHSLVVVRSLSRISKAPSYKDLAEVSTNFWLRQKHVGHVLFPNYIPNYTIK